MLALASQAADVPVAHLVGHYTGSEGAERPKRRSLWEKRRKRLICRQGKSPGQQARGDWGWDK
ncbi:hypothetical protein SGGMMB4_01208 [Sodalis glossinidius str. 'morsitans']|uniref:Uncharacterized protein n=1 Tax=Sodalis glossinidius (strain morsitans) TaxID=343509 RepID=A0A193QGD3_SODGM|nr:hypothetical protein SGGMMB4_01208 [Sodalis glossinidius str. 'morsitans']